MPEALSKAVQAWLAGPATGPPTIPSAKLAPPVPRRETIGRAGVVRAISAASESPLVVINAPAGYGKTTALAQWVEASDITYAWLSLDEGDDDPQRLAALLLASLERALPGSFDEAGQALRAGASVANAVIPLLAAALEDGDGEPLAIVVDDSHLLVDEACARVARRLLASLPPGVTVVFAGRSTPPLRLGRRRAAGTVAELGPDDLRLDMKETRLLLNGSFGLRLDREALALVEERLRGWPAGLALLAGELVAPPRRTCVQTALERSCPDLDAYVAEEVLGALRPELADFLLRTSLLTRLSASLCEAVTRNPRAGGLLEEARRTGLFVTAEQPGGPWLRYHPAFAAILAERLRRREPRLVRELHRRAAAWHEREGMTDEASRHALRAGDEPHASALRLLQMDREGVDKRLTAEQATVLAAEHGRDPRIRLAVDSILISPFYGEVKRAGELAREAWERYEGEPALRSRLAPRIALVRWFAGEHREARALLEPRLALDLPLADAIWTRAALAMAVGSEGDAEAAEDYAREAWSRVPAARGDAGTDEFAAVPWILGEALRTRANLREARERMRLGLEGEARRPGSVGQALALLYDARLAHAEGDGQRARRSARASRRIVERYPDLGVVPALLTDLEESIEGAAGSVPQGSRPTPAERRVLALLDSDLSLAGIAAELYLTRATVKSHTRRLYRRLGAGNREEAVLNARRRGLLAERAEPAAAPALRASAAAGSPGGG